MREILYKAKGRDGEGWIEGYYWRTRDTTFCFHEDYEKIRISPIIISCLTR